jgi:hypothetical protein
VTQTKEFFEDTVTKFKETILDGKTTVNESPYESALHLAFYCKAPLNVEHLLKYMAKMETRGAANFRDIMHLLVEYNNFDKYLEHMFV